MEKVKESSRELTIFMIFFISLFKITHAVAPDARNLILIPAFGVDAVAVDPYGIRTLQLMV